MSFSRFKNMTLDEASEILKEFRENGHRYLPEFVADFDLDFSLARLPAFMEWIALRLNTIAIKENPAVPQFIRESRSYKFGLYEFTLKSNGLIIGSAYYLGECFIRSYPSLKWSIGNPEFALRMMPVVTGFGHQKELAVLVVTENLLRRRIENPEKSCVFENAIQVWMNSVVT